ncbi:MAG: RNA polymerase sigma factor [Anaerovoracaceae bacterium]|jgi:RNA polymerase sigma-70 factor (ECF subfamily)
MNDSELVLKIQEGSRDAFDELYKKYSTMLFRVAYMYLGNREDAEEVLQETFVQFWLNAGSLKNPASVRFWLYRTMHRLAVKTGKKHAKERPDENVILKADAASAEQTTMEEGVVNKLAFDTIMRSLSPKLRETAVLYYCDDLSVKEIAKITECREGTVKSRLHSVRKQLAKQDDLRKSYAFQMMRREGTI